MGIKELFLLSYREIRAYRTRSRATIITIGVLFGLLFGVVLVFQGLENVTLKYAGSATNGKIYLTSLYQDIVNDNQIIYERIEKYNGKVVENKEETTIIAEFENIVDAYEYFQKTDFLDLHYNSDRYYIREINGEQITAYHNFNKFKKDFIVPAIVILLVVAVFILDFTMSHIMAQSGKTFVLYRSLGASKKQLVLIYFFYMLQLCVRAMIFAAVVGIFLAGISTAVGWNYLLIQLANNYPKSPHYSPILFGVNWQLLEITLLMLLCAPLSFLFCLDQFQTKKNILKLKGD